MPENLSHVDAIFDNQGIDPKYRDLNNFFFEQVPEGSAHTGEWYAIPRMLYEGISQIGQGKFFVRENGSIVNTNTLIDNVDTFSTGTYSVVNARRVAGEVSVEHGAMIGSDVHLEDSTVGIFSTIGKGSSVVRSKIAAPVRIGHNNNIADSTISPSTQTGSFVEIFGSTVGSDSLMEDGSRILYSTTRTSLKLGEKALIQSAGVGDNVEVQEGAVVAQATVGDNVLVMPKQRAEGRVKSSSVVRPDKYKRSRKSDGSVEWEM